MILTFRKHNDLEEHLDKAAMITLSWINFHDNSRNIIDFTNKFVQNYDSVLNYKASMSIKNLNLINNKSLKSSISTRNRSKS